MTHDAMRGRVRRRGAAAIELALVLPVLCLLCLITADYSRVFYALTTLSDCARAGAVYYAMTPSAAVSSVQHAALAGATDLIPQPTVDVASGTNVAGNAYVQVTVTYHFSSLSSFPGIPTSTTLSRKVVMMPNPP
ncbi:TadE/TadG family type IV pilus assembly protein [Isosphaeraceae bacterium EP7]